MQVYLKSAGNKSRPTIMEYTLIITVALYPENSVGSIQPTWVNLNNETFG